MGRLLLAVSVASVIGFGVIPWAKAQASPPPASESWTATTQSVVNDAAPSRTIEKYSKSANRSVREQRTDVIGPSGTYEPYSATETETINDGQTAQFIIRSYGYVNGERQLVQITSETRHHLADGGSNSERITSSPDNYGKLCVVQREITTETVSGPTSRQTHRTVYDLDASGNLVPSMKIHERQTLAADRSATSTKTVELPDGSGKWQVAEQTERTVNSEGRTEVAEEVTSRPDYKGDLSQASRTVSRKSKDNGRDTSTVEVYSADVPGLAMDGNLRLVTRSTTSRHTNSGSIITEQQIEQADPLAGGGGHLTLTTKASETLTLGPSGFHKTKTTEARGLDGQFIVVSDEHTQSDQMPMDIQVSAGDQSH